jgi:glyoxylase-like metal-dependent hydrolase (beta-lactamase superfamily II)
MSSSRRDFLAGSAAALVTGVVGYSWPALAGQRGRGRGQQASATFTMIRRNVGFFTGRGGTIGYLVNTDGVVVVDSQFPESAELCLAGLRDRSGNKPVDFLINSHHHGDHTAGNIVFKDVARHVVAHEMAARHQRELPGRTPLSEEQLAQQLFPDTTFRDTWSESVGDETIGVKHYGRAHTSGDVVITFEQANVAHMGDLMFNRRHPVVDRPAGAILTHWIEVLEGAVADHDADTAYIFGHGGQGQPVTGDVADLLHFRDYLTALIEHMRREVAAGKSEEDITSFQGTLPGFDAHGPLNRTILGNAYAEVSGG